MLPFVLAISILLLITQESSCSINPIRIYRNIYKEGMCVLIDTDGIYDIISFENSSITFNNVSIEIKERSAENVRRLISQFKENFTTRYNLRHRFYAFFEYEIIKNVYSLLQNFIFDRYYMESKVNMEFIYYNHTRNRSRLAIVFYNLRNGTTLGLTSFNTSRIFLGYTPNGVKIVLSDRKNRTWSSILQDYVLLYIKIHRNLNLTIYDMKSSITLSKDCLDICKIPNSPYENFQKNLIFYESNGSYWKDQILGQSIGSSRHNTFELHRELTSGHRHDLMVVYTTYIQRRENSHTDLNWLNKVYQSPWYYLEFPGYSIGNLISICNDIDAKDCYKIDLKQTFTNKTLISFLILQENINGKIYLFERYEENFLVLSDIKIPQIKFINASVFNESLDEYYKVLNQIHIVLKDCKENRHILQAFDPLAVAIHRNLICIIEESGIYEIVGIPDELSQSIDIKVTNIKDMNGTQYRHLASSLNGDFRTISDFKMTNYSVFKRQDIFNFINAGLGSCNKFVCINQDKKINMNFESYENWGNKTVIELSTINIFTAQLEPIYVELSYKKPKARIEISNSTIRIKIFLFGIQIEDYK